MSLCTMTFYPFHARSVKRGLHKRKVKWHMNVHLEQSLKCQGYERVFPTSEKRYSHFRGAHGKGYDSLCGKNFQWPVTRARHQAKCDTYKALKRKKDNAKKKRKLSVDNVEPVKKECKVLKKEKVESTIKDMKARIGLKIENFLDLKKDL